MALHGRRSRVGRGSAWRAGALALALVVGLVVLRADAARACGGLFCSSASPVNQAAERIVFSFDRPAKKVTAVVEILYEGPSEKFAWVLPVPGIPTFDLSTSAMLDRLQASTNPSYGIQRSWGNNCNGGPLATTPGAGGASGSAADPGGTGKTEVSVLASGSVGPYEYDVIAVDPTLADPAMAAITWLMAHAFDVGALGPDVLRPYLRDGLNLLAFKLAKNRATGSIRPIMLTYTTDRPMIPIRPTAVAANNDMGILVFVLGAARAVPSNYKTLELNEALIDWFNPNAMYNAVVSAAADEAGGQGFVTEMATSTAMGGFASGLYQEQGTVQKFRTSADGWGDAELIAETVELFASFGMGGFSGPFGSRPASGRVALDGVADVLASTLTLPTGVKVEDVMASPRCYFAAFRQGASFYCDGKVAPTTLVDLTGFDRIAFLKAVEKLVIHPLEATAQLFADQPYLTRLYTTMSAAEMTLDPEFDLNSELGDVSNAHQVMLTYTKSCPGDTSGAWEALIGGLTVRGEGNAWPISAQTQKMPYNRRVVQLSTSGMGAVIADNTTTIATALGGSQPGIKPKSDGGCAIGGAPGAPIAPAGVPVKLAALFVAIAVLGRRRARPASPGRGGAPADR